MKTIREKIDNALKDRFSPSEMDYVRKSLCTEYLGISEVSYFTGTSVVMTSEMELRLSDALKRLSSGEPLQYVLGTTYMGGLSFHVDRRVLIPRPETSELVGWVETDLRNEKAGRLVDIGTGSGYIAITLSLLLRDWTIEGWDISGEALEVAEYNNRINGAGVIFSKTDILGYDECKKDTFFDAIVSNPPYIAVSESLEMDHTVLDYEPHTALFVPDDDPLLFYRNIADFGREHLHPSGVLYFEINPLFADEMVPMFKYKGYNNVEMRKDISGKWRFIKCKF